MMPKTIIITGASDGIGAASARQLKAKGHHVVLVGRSRTKTERLAREIDAPYHLADYTKLNDVKRLADELNQYDRIDVLANNAGGIMGDKEMTADGFEKTFQVNHLAPFLLTCLLMDRLIASSATVIQTASIAANVFGKDFSVTDLNNDQHYASQTAYGHSKLANILFTRELDRRHRSDGISTVAFHPGVVRSSFASETNHIMRLIYHTPLKYLATISPEKSGRMLTALIEGKPETDWQPGEVYSKGKPMDVTFKDDGSVARELWLRSEQFLKNA